MKKHMKSLLVCCSLITVLWSCAKDKNDDPGKQVNPPTTPVGKKGVDFDRTYQNGSWAQLIVKLKGHWFYTWGTDVPFDLAPKNAEFVPMFWGKGSITDQTIANAKQMKASGKANYVLGFNEPDLGDQSNMSVQDALAAWPKLESIGLPLGSPATAWPTVQWMYDFMDQAIAQKRRVDFICVHMYVGTDDVHFVKTLQDLYDKYHKPIWITEFATVANDAKTISDNPYTPETVLAFMQRLLPKLEALDFVQRYSWFSGDINSPRLWSSALVDGNGNLTALGKWYADYKVNTNVKQ